MSIDAVWTVKFAMGFDWGPGVMILDTQRIYGGDGQYLYVGEYAVKDGAVEEVPSSQS